MDWRNIWVQPYEYVRGYAYCYLDDCGRDANYMLGRTSNLTDKRYSDPVCSKHVRGWLSGVDAVKFALWGETY